MTKPMIRIHNAETNEIIDREMNDDEFAQYEIDQKNYLAKEGEAEKLSLAKTAALNKLTALGLTIEDLRALGF